MFKMAVKSDSDSSESVAKATGKPLFSVSVSDIGLKPSEVEHSLEVLFELAATWRAVMLLSVARRSLPNRLYTHNLAATKPMCSSNPGPITPLI